MSDEFIEFRKQFYIDSIYQINHIIFPLKGIYSDRMEIDDTVYIWQQKEDWVFQKNPDEDKELITNITIKGDTIVEELSHLDEGGFWYLVRFEKVNNNWFLTRFEFVY